jgi:hypothetical protein
MDFNLNYYACLLGTSHASYLLFIQRGLSLQYADDTLLFLEHDYNLATHLKWLMTCFEKLSGMRINYNKSDLTQST